MILTHWQIARLEVKQFKNLDVKCITNIIHGKQCVDVAAESKNTNAGRC